MGSQLLPRQRTPTALSARRRAGTWRSAGRRPWQRRPSTHCAAAPPTASAACPTPLPARTHRAGPAATHKGVVLLHALPGEEAQEEGHRNGAGAHGPVAGWPGGGPLSPRGGAHGPAQQRRRPRRPLPGSRRAAPRRHSHLEGMPRLVNVLGRYLAPVGLDLRAHPIPPAGAAAQLLLAEELEAHQARHSSAEKRPRGGAGGAPAHRIGLEACWTLDGVCVERGGRWEGEGWCAALRAAGPPILKPRPCSGSQLHSQLFPTSGHPQFVIGHLRAPVTGVHTDCQQVRRPVPKPLSLRPPAAAGLRVIA